MEKGVNAHNSASSEYNNNQAWQAMHCINKGLVTLSQ